MIEGYNKKHVEYLFKQHCLSKQHIKLQGGLNGKRRD